MNRQTNSGFTLIELMVVIAVIGILAAIAVPTFIEQVRKSRRSEAMQILSELQMRQERYRTNNTTYGTTLATIGVSSATIDSGYYTLSVSTPSGSCANGTTAANSNSFAITATAAGAQASDTKCATMVLTSLCGVVSKTSTPSGNSCW